MGNDDSQVNQRRHHGVVVIADTAPNRAHGSQHHQADNPEFGKHLNKTFVVGNKKLFQNPIASVLKEIKLRKTL
jgi:hypothetical protein